MPILKIEHADEILIAHVRFSDAQVTRTVEIERNRILVDEDGNGNIVGIELLFPTKIAEAVRRVAEHYKNPAIASSVDDLLGVC